MAEERKLIEQQKEEDRLQRHLEMRERIETKRNTRVMNKMQGDLNIKDYLKQKPLYKQIEERYQEEVAIPEKDRL